MHETAANGYHFEAGHRTKDYCTNQPKDGVPLVIRGCMLLAAFHTRTIAHYYGADDVVRMDRPVHGHATN